MATNTNKGHRKGAIKEQSQFYNAATWHYTKRDAETGRILEVKKDQTLKFVIYKKVNKC